MPEYLAPGVVVEEVSFRAKSIEGVATTTTGIVGPTRLGPLLGEPEVMTSLEEFERVHGDGEDLDLGAAGRTPNYVWHAVARFFDLGGRRLYVQRVAGDGAAAADAALGGAGGSVTIAALTEGAAGDGEIDVRLVLGPNLVSQAPDGTPRVAALREGELVWISDEVSADAVESEPVPGSPPAEGVRTDTVGTAVQATTSVEGRGRVHTGNFAVTARAGGQWVFDRDGRPDMSLAEAAAPGVTVRRVTLMLERRDASAAGAAGLSLDVTGTDPRSAFAADGQGPFRLTQTDVATPGEAAQILGASLPALAGAAGLPLFVSDAGVIAERRVRLSGGADGDPPGADAYQGAVDAQDRPSGLRALERIEEISIVAAPGHTRGYETDDASVQRADAITQALIAHAERVRYCIAVLDSGDGQTVGQVQAQRAKVDSTHAALYYPWVSVVAPSLKKRLELPPSCFVPGIYARNDNTRGVWKAPANEVVTGAIGFERPVSHGQQEVLNPLGVNCFRFFEGRGFRLWGARTATSDPEWKYVNLRRYFAYLERSIDRGTQWAVFEPNGSALWSNVRRAVSDFLFNEFVSGALLGDKPEQAFFVRCDRSTMTQNDLDNGRLICLVGVAPLRPAEFVIFRVGQWTADRR